MFLAVDARERRDDVIRSVRDERGMVVGQQDAIAVQEIEQVRHLLEVGGNVRVITGEMDVVEMYIDDVLDSAPRGIQGAGLALQGHAELHDCKNQDEKCRP